MTTNEEWMALMTKVEDLHPDLVPYVTEGTMGPMLSHPLVYAIPLISNALANAGYAAKKGMLTRAMVERDWHQVIWIHEKPFRLQALMEIGSEMSNTDYWRLVAEVWMGTENAWQNTEEWIDVLGAGRPGRDKMMDATEKAALKALGETFTIYRGARTDVNEEGLSWTTDKERARWFAKRHDRSGAIVLTATVQASDVVALLLGRGEDEIVLFEPRMEWIEEEA